MEEKDEENSMETNLDPSKKQKQLSTSSLI